MDHEARYKQEADKNLLRFVRDEINFSEWNRRQSELVKDYDSARLSLDRERVTMFGENDEGLPSQEEWSAWVD